MNVGPIKNLIHRGGDLSVGIAYGRDSSGVAAADVRKLGEAVADIALALLRLTDEVERESTRDGVPLGDRIRR